MRSDCERKVGLGGNEIWTVKE
ncbi:uncharacterized protein G2W53_003675 [Senna tora]|uniref:Uncharacterized protein n=1 Tax=Senna tora TaxID=362788 RepID=A0A834XB42_9FABA|nr:uncharacterized protein G2W53_003675 [Senna tora]